MLALGLKALKLRLGYPTLAEDLAALDAVRDRVGTSVAIMVDYNQALTPAEALKPATRSTSMTSSGSKSRSPRGLPELCAADARPQDLSPDR